MANPTTFRVTTYWKRKRSEPGLTQLASKRLDLGQALTWIIDELPDEAYQVTYLNDKGKPLPEGLFSDKVRLDIDWGKVPFEIRNGGL
jgi:hypothetical protein